MQVLEGMPKSEAAACVASAVAHVAHVAHVAVTRRGATGPGGWGSNYWMCVRSGAARPIRVITCRYARRTMSHSRPRAIRSSHRVLMLVTCTDPGRECAQ